MSTKKQRRAKRKAKQAERASNPNRVVPLFDSSLSPALQGRFAQWLTERVIPDDPDQVAMFVRRVSLALDDFADQRPGFRPDAWTRADVDGLESMLASIGEEFGPEARIATTLPVTSFLEFLVESDLWAGTDEVATYAIERLEQVFGLRYVGADIAPVDEDEERAALLATGVLQRITAFLDWLGDGKPVTQTGWLKLAAARDLATALDVPVYEHLRSMGDHPYLSGMWNYLKVLDLVDVGSTRATPGPRVPEWTDQSLDFLRSALATWVGGRLPKPNALASVRSDVGAQVIGVVIQAMSSSPVTDADIDRWRDDEIGADLGYLVREYLSAFVAEGWLYYVDGAYVIPEGLRPAVVSAIPEPPDLPDLPAIGMLTLRVELEYVQPAVWRTIRVHSDTMLGELHEMLQVIFDWEDSHLHQFAAGDAVYIPGHQLPDDLDSRDNTENEDLTAVGDILRRKGDQAIYEYDFGDGWTHRMTVVDLDEDEDDDAKQGVVEGAGMAPFEDVGGPPGWEHFLAAVNTPSHPEHQNLRRWAGIPAGVSVDAKVFDVGAVNRQLDRLGLR
ncbi:plasmid pRiA4b ORF-3 family protein [Gordonia sp. VNQ95]|jgi:hypothetical protein|uniref:plasmid pRiA4b ORF-3 family protein n=1 Tax=Gordonia sp. VNQ95 TaxID=3156619 RepID=UPI0032B62796